VTAGLHQHKPHSVDLPPPDLNRRDEAVDSYCVDASAYALVHGVRSTRGALASWRARPSIVLRPWFAGSLAVASLLLLTIWVVAAVKSGTHGPVSLARPPFVVGGVADLARIVGHNLLVLALHAMACVAGFIAGSSLPLQAEQHTGFVRVLHERGKPIAIGFVMCAITFSLSWQTYALGTALAHVSASAHVSTTLLLVGLLPHALPELVALFLPLSAWMVASRRKEWDRLLAATFVTVGVAVPMLVLTGLWEVFVAPHVLTAIFGHGLTTH
jgi:hypothetical protein